jgi:hypothetical protein
MNQAANHRRGAGDLFLLRRCVWTTVLCMEVVDLETARTRYASADLQGGVSNVPIGYPKLPFGLTNGWPRTYWALALFMMKLLQ